MNRFLKHIWSVFPSALLAILLAISVWIVAITQKDPTEERRFTNTVTVELRGLDDGMVMTNLLPETVNILMRAPVSTWQKIINRRIAAKAIIDVTGLSTGDHTVPIQIEIDSSPIQITSYAPQTVKVSLEKYETRSFDIAVSEVGEIPTAFRADEPIIEPASVEISGPVSQLDQIDKVRVVLDVTNATESITKTLPPAAINHAGAVINAGLKYATDKIKVTLPISLRGGYRVVVVKAITTGATLSGYVLDGLTVNPTVATIYSSDPKLIEQLPGFIETNLIDLSEYTEETNVKVGLKLPASVSLVGDQTVNVTVRVSPVEGSRTISDVPVYTIGVEDGLFATVSPGMIDVYLTGPQAILEKLSVKDFYAVIELQDKTVGQHQVTPQIDISAFPGLKIQSVSPVTIDVSITE